MSYLCKLLDEAVWKTSGRRGRQKEDKRETRDDKRIQGKVIGQGSNEGENLHSTESGPCELSYYCNTPYDRKRASETPAGLRAVDLVVWWRQEEN